jgi:2',3'-cyclic-nucleotide 2'-phosphodiesterase/3'-nucleotidase
VAAGPLTLRSAADLYFYPNTLAAVKTDGAGLKAWLEKSAQRFNRIDPHSTAAQQLINSHYVGYNFDQIQGDIHYVIDVSKPVGERITKLTWKDKPVRSDAPFIIVTNNYRANGGGHFPGLDGSNIVLAAPDGTREILAKWIEQKKQIGVGDLEPTSWSFAALKTRGPVVFSAAVDKLDVARAAGLTNIRQLKDNGNGTATYAIDLSL